MFSVAPPTLMYAPERNISQVWKELGGCPNIVPVCPTQLNGKEVTLSFHSQSKTFIMGILNATPDSFSDAGDYSADDIGKTLNTVKGWVEKGLVDIVDIGGESTRPGLSLFA